MVLLHHQQPPSRKRHSSSSSSFVPPAKIPKSQNDGVGEDAQSVIDKMASILADAGCTLTNNARGPPSLPPDAHKFRAHLNRVFSSSSENALDFIAGFASYIQQSPTNLRRVIATAASSSSASSSSLVRNLLMVPAIQLDIQQLLLETLPEYFFCVDAEAETPLEDDVARLIINQFRWLDFVVHPDAFTAKLMEVLSICPLHLKKEIIGSLPEIVGPHTTKQLLHSLHQMLLEDSSIMLPLLHSFSNLCLDEMLQDQVISVALSCIRTIDREHMPYLLRFLLLSATPLNVRRIITHIRQQLKFAGLSNCRATQPIKLKGKSVSHSTDASILEALRSSLLFKDMLCQEILKELNSLENPQDHKVLDMWLLVLIYMNGKSMQKSVEKILKKKIVENCIQEVMIDQCILGNKELVQDYFPSFLSVSEYLLACKEQKARAFGIHMYTCLFEEFTDSYSRQEVLGALVSHVGSSISFEVDSALETLALLASKYAPEMIPLSTHINGILDYLEGFSIQNLHKAYEIFSRLMLTAQLSPDCFRSSIANELLLIVRKQVSHPDIKYKKMGIIGTLEIVSCLGDANNITSTNSSQKSICQETLELLRTSLESSKRFCLLLVLFYDELTALLDRKKLHSDIVEWIGKHVGEFESMFLSDLEGGQLSGKDSHCSLEGELWMNLDGDISPICLNILSLASSSLQSMSSLQILPANFLLLSSIERLTNDGSLGGIDALIGCPLHLPSSKYFSTAGWQSLTSEEKQILCLSLYYATNWIRELLNAFCTQVAGRSKCMSQATKDDIVAKLLKRLRNLIFLESLLNNFIKCYPVCLPELHLHVEHAGTSFSNQVINMVHVEKNIEQEKTNSLKKRKCRKILKESMSSDTNGKVRQSTILDILRKAGAVTSEEGSNEHSSGPASVSQTFASADQDSCNSNNPVVVEVSAVPTALEAQRSKFRPLLVQCFSLLTFSKNQNSCCSDPMAELPLHLYLLRDLHYKLDYFCTPRKQFFAQRSTAPAGLTRITVEDFLRKITPLFASIRGHFDSAVSILKKGDETCVEHWNVYSAAASNPDLAGVRLSKSSVSASLFQEALQCFSKMLNLSDIQMDKSVLSDLLEAFQPDKISEHFTSETQPWPLSGTIEHLYLGVFSFLEDVLDIACTFSFKLASVPLLTLESVVMSVQRILDMSDNNSKNITSIPIPTVLPTLRSRLATSARKILMHNWDSGSPWNDCKNKGEIVQKVLLIYLENSESKSDLLDELACSTLPQVSSSKTKTGDNHCGFPTLCNATFVVWYRVLHEVNVANFSKLVKEVGLLTKPKTGVQLETVELHLIKMQKSVNVVVSLVNMCRMHDKVTVHAIAVKYGGKFVDSFLKVFDFLQAHFQTHKGMVIQLLKELQKATRIIQTLCSEAKGLKQTAITSKIPPTKRSMERFLFRVKALLHTTPSGCTFWMGNLKHKDLTGQVVSSQAYADDQIDQVVEDEVEAVDEHHSGHVSIEDERKTE